MKLSECNVGFGITGSFCTFDKIKPQIKNLVDEGANITPVFSYNVQNLDTRFCKASDFISDIKNITGKDGIYTIQQAETVGPGKLFDIMVIAPCTGNTMSKLANGITDTPVLMAAKAHLRNGKPLVIAVSTNDGLGVNLQNIGKLMITKNIFFVPYGQDDSIKKPNSLVADLKKLKDTIIAALDYNQIQPVLYK